MSENADDRAQDEGQQPPNQPQPQGQQPPNQPQPQGQRPPGQPRQGRRQQTVGAGRSEEVNFAIFGVLVYAVVGLGAFVTGALGSLLGGDASLVVASNDELFQSARSALSEFVTIAPILGAVVAVYYHRTSVTMERTPKAAAIAAAAGVLAVSILLVLLLVIFEPSSGSNATSLQPGSGVSVELGDEITAILGIAIGTVATAGATGFVLEEDPLDIL